MVFSNILASLPSAVSMAPALPSAARRPASRRLRRDTALAVGGIGLRYHLRHALDSGVPTCAEACTGAPQRHRGLAVDPTRRLAEAGAAREAESAGRALLAACDAATSWPGIGLSVKLDYGQLAGHAIIGQLGDALDRSGLNPERLEFSILEADAARIGPDELLTLSALRDLGVGLAIADFGHEQASLAMLRRLPLTTVKLAAGMVWRVREDPEDAAIAAAVIMAAHAIGLCVVAGGLTDEAQRACLAAYGCDEAQGALFGPALQVAEVAVTL